LHKLGRVDAVSFSNFADLPGLARIYYLPDGVRCRTIAATSSHAIELPPERVLREKIPIYNDVAGLEPG